MCQACGNRCCDALKWGECGCNDCDVPECWEICDDCGQTVPYCECEDGPEDEELDGGIFFDDDADELDSLPDDPWWQDV